MMTKKLKRRKRDANAAVSAPVVRRMPAPKDNRSRAAARQALEWAGRTQINPLENPFVEKLVEVIRDASAVSGISAYTILADFAAMFEANLRLETEIFKHRLLTQDPWQDPPEEAVIFAKARARIMKVSEKRPVVYQKMSDTFLAMINILMQAANYGLAFYVENRQFSPDVISQAFVACLKPGPLWLSYFVPWDVALADVNLKINLDEAWDRILAELAQATARAGVPLPETGGENWEMWFKTILPFTHPYVIGVDSVTMMLAAAAQFPDWIVFNDLVRVGWQKGFEPDPVAATLARVNIELYALNEVYSRYRRAYTEGLDALREDRVAPRPLESFAPDLIYQNSGNEEGGVAQTEHAPPPDWAESSVALFRGGRSLPGPQTPSMGRQEALSKSLQNIFAPLKNVP